jgi:hypothetical protein
MKQTCSSSCSPNSVLLCPKLQKATDSPDLPLVRLSDICRLSVYILNPIAVPMMPCASDQVTGVLVTADPWLRRQIRVITQIKPHIRAAVNKSEVLGFDVPSAVLVVVVQFRRLGDAVMLTSRKGPCAGL